MTSKTAYRLAFAAVLALIVYGSLHPWRFVGRPAGDPVAVLFRSWPRHWGWRLEADAVLNILGYVPLGFFGYAAFAGRRRWLAAGAVVVLGTLVSASVEMAQFFVPGRTTSFSDLVMNAFGTALGTGVAALASTLGLLDRRTLRVPLDAAACLAVWALWQGWPFLPHPSLHRLLDKLRVLAAAPFSAGDMVMAAAAAMGAGALLEAVAGRQRNLVLLGAALALVPAKMLIVGRTTTPAELAGALGGWLLWAAVSRLRHRTAIAAAAMSGALIYSGLRALPGPVIHVFSWMPLAGYISARQQLTATIIFGKVFWYTTALWLLRRVTGSYRAAGIAVVVLLAGLEAAQLRIPGRSPEITDPFLAVLAACALYALENAGETTARARGAARRS